MSIITFASASIANDSPTLQIVSSESMVGVAAGNHVFIGTSNQPRQVLAVDTGLRTITLTINWTDAAVTTLPCSVVTMSTSAAAAVTKAVEEIAYLVTASTLLQERFLGVEGAYKQYITAKFAAIQSLMQGRVSKATLADLDADLAHEENTLAEVWNDPTQENNGLYGKLGVSGAGSWERSEYDTLLTVARADFLDVFTKSNLKAIAELDNDGSVSEDWAWGVVNSANQLALAIDLEGKTHLELADSYLDFIYSGAKLSFTREEKQALANFAFEDIEDEEFVYGVLDQFSNVAIGVDKNGKTYADLQEDLKQDIANQAFDNTYGETDFIWGVLDSVGKLAIAIDRSGKTHIDRPDEITSQIHYENDFVYGVLDQFGKVALGVDKSGKTHIERPDEIVSQGDFSDDFVWGITDQNSKVALGLKKNGKLYFEPDPSVTGLGSPLTIDELNGPGNNYMPVSSSSTTVDYLADGEGVVRAYRMRTDYESVTAMFTAKGPIEYLPATGQSLSVGGGATENPSGQEVFTETPIYPNHCFMFNTGTRGAQGSVITTSVMRDLIPAYEQFNGDNQAETQGSGMMRALHNYNEQNGILQTYLYRSHGRGGATIQELSKGSEFPMFNNGIEEVRKAVELAGKYGREIQVRAFTWTQGENNRSTDFATYYALLDQLVTDYRTDYALELPETNPPLHCIIDQLAAASTGGGSDVPLAQYQLAKDRSYVHLSTPKYFLEYSATVHLVPKYYSILGEYQARVWRTLFIDNAEWQPCWPLTVTRTSNVIDIGCHVPVGNLVIDTVTLPAATNYGFTFTDDSGSTPTITSVEIFGANVIRVTLSAIPTGTVKNIEYANSGPGATGRSGAWGNIHDSETKTSQSDNSFVMYNWLMIFNSTVD
jgi:hypothetical protein